MSEQLKLKNIHSLYIFRHHHFTVYTVLSHCAQCEGNKIEEEEEEEKDGKNKRKQEYIS